MTVKIDKNLLFILKIVISLGLISFLIHRIDVNKVLGSIESAEKHLLLLGYLLGIANVIACTIRWRILLSEHNISISFIRLIKIYFIGMFFNTFLPTGYGGDVVRGYKVYKMSSMLGDSISSVIMERIVGFSALISISLVSLALSIRFVSTQIVCSLLGIVCFFFLILGILFNKDILKYFNPFISIFRMEQYRAQFADIYNKIISYKDLRYTLIKVYAISIISHCIMILSIHVFSMATGSHIPVIYFFMFIPIINIITMVPITLNGLGVREGGFIYFFSLAKVLASDSFLISLLFFSQLLFIALIGCILYLCSFN